MSENLYTLTRQQIAEFVKDQRTVRALERAVKQSNVLLPADVVTLTRLIEESFIEGANANTKGQQALDIIESIQESLKLIELAPPKIEEDDDSVSILLAAIEAKLNESLDKSTAADIKSRSNSVLLWLSIQ